MGCREADLKSNLVRLAASSQGVVPDLKGRLGGRGGYLHPRRQCLKRFVEAKVKSFTSLRRSLSRAERLALVEQLERLVSVSEQ